MSEIEGDQVDIKEMSYLKDLYPKVWWWFEDQYCEAGHHQDSKSQFEDQRECSVSNERIFLIMMKMFDNKIAIFTLEKEIALLRYSISNSECTETITVGGIIEHKSDMCNLCLLIDELNLKNENLANLKGKE